MSWLRAFTVVSLVVLWLPLRMHCQLEMVPGLNFLTCCEKEESAAQQKDDCQKDGCVSVESGFYETLPQFFVFSALILENIQPAPLVLDLAQLAFARGFEVLNNGPPELPRTWQFSWRTALPPRAPSVIS